ncbi:hypothetical protein LRD69_14090 [Streptomyces sp. JH14]|uniref:hypothetical protein n=1 Tax=Streptomyces sp. JH14 TaxID=2793630 RepID=UPI0023F71B48|nr:hypothetical protein [Streptomyces sp. JH14]MDF6043259.1 hypothetical protein [Streptomyces sp. JH14]
MVATDPTWINGVTLDAQELRRVDQLLVMHNGTAMGGRAGVVPGGNGLGVSIAGSTITVGAGTAWVYQSGQGMYRAALASGATATLTAAHATLARIDLVYLRVWDNAVDASGLNKADAVYLAGTASSTPVAPVPAGTQIYIPLATISVPASGGGSPSVSTTVRPITVAPGGILPLQTAAPTSPYTGQFYDNGNDLLRYNGSTWETYQKKESVGFTTVSVGTGYTQGDSSTNGNLNGPLRYRKITDRGVDFIEWAGGATRVSGAQTTNVLSTALAAGLRPAYRASFVVPRNGVAINGVSNTNSVIHSLKVDFNQDGTVALFSQDAGPPSSVEALWFTVAGCRYPLT